MVSRKHLSGNRKQDSVRSWCGRTDRCLKSAHHFSETDGQEVDRSAGHDAAEGFCVAACVQFACASIEGLIMASDSLAPNRFYRLHTTHLNFFDPTS